MLVKWTCLKFRVSEVRSWTQLFCFHQATTPSQKRMTRYLQCSMNISSSWGMTIHFYRLLVCLGQTLLRLHHIECASFTMRCIGACKCICLSGSDLCYRWETRSRTILSLKCSYWVREPYLLPSFAPHALWSRWSALCWYQSVAHYEMLNMASSWKCLLWKMRKSER